MTKKKLREKSVRSYRWIVEEKNEEYWYVVGILCGYWEFWPAFYSSENKPKLQGWILPHSKRFQIPPILSTILKFGFSQLERVFPKKGSNAFESRSKSPTHFKNMPLRHKSKPGTNILPPFPFSVSSNSSSFVRIPSPLLTYHRVIDFSIAPRIVAVASLPTEALFAFHANVRDW